MVSPVNKIESSDIDLNQKFLFEGFFFVLIFLRFCVSSVISYTDSLGSCASNRKKCSQFADCKDYPSGYCCHCRPGFYGNGIQCVAEGNCTFFVVVIFFSRVSDTN